MIILHAMFDWPNIANNPTTLKRAYQILFYRLIEILRAVKESFDKIHVNCRGNLAYTSWAMHPGLMYSGIYVAQGQNVLPQLEELFDIVWEVSKDHFPYAQILFDPALDDDDYVSDDAARHSKGHKAKDVPETWKKPLEEWLEKKEINDNRTASGKVCGS